MPKIVKCCGQFVGSKGSGTRRAYLMVFKGDQEIQIPTFWGIAQTALQLG